MKCRDCGLVFDDFMSLVKHIKNCSANVDFNILKCGEINCIRQFSDPRQFRNHLVSVHSITTGCHKKPAATKSPLEGGNRGTDVADVDMIDESPSSESPLTIVHKLTCKFLANLYLSPGVTRSAIQVFVKSLEEFLIEAVPILEKLTLQALNENTDTRLVTSTYSSFIKGILSPFRTEFLRLNEFKTQGSYFPPREVVIGYRTDHSLRNNEFKMVPTPCSVQVIPMTSLFEKFLSNIKVLGMIFEYLRRLKAAESEATTTNMPLCIENVMQASVWKTMTRDADESSLVLPLVIYYDDFEVGNPLGGHSGVHKLGGLYMALPFLPPELFSLLNFIFLISLNHSLDKSEFGNDKIFAPAIAELNSLQSEGIILKTSIFEGRVKFKVVAITGDNLGLNDILNFNASFVANKCCRMCNIDKIGLQNEVREKRELLRTMSLYYEQLYLDDSKETGIKGRCCWLDLTGFDLFQNVAVDAMHDHLEGVARNTMTFILNSYLTAGICQPIVINAAITSFNYGPDDDSKPSGSLVFDQLGKVKLRCSASEMSTLIRYFGLIVGPYVPPENEMWDLFLLLRQILDILLAYRIYNETADRLDTLVAEFNALFMKLTSEKLKPKNHFLTHYGGMMRKFGPLRSIWAMRFEAKHRPLKSVARSTSSRVNITKTIAMRNQLVLNSVLSSDSIPELMKFGKELKIVKKKYAELRDFTAYHSVFIAGVKWEKNSIFAFDFEEDSGLPIFGLIELVLKSSDSEVHFYSKIFHTLGFNEHLQAYEVVATSEYRNVKERDLLFPFPNTLINVANETYITVRWYIEK